MGCVKRGGKDKSQKLDAKHVVLRSVRTVSLNAARYDFSTFGDLPSLELIQGP